MPIASSKKVPIWWYLADPYLRWAHHTRFRYFSQPDNASFGILFELANPLEKLPKEVAISDHYLGQRFVTADIELAKYNAQLGVIATTLGAKRIELASPVTAPRAATSRPEIRGGKGPRRIIGFVDDGCPFAHANLRLNGKSRVAFLWDQDATSPATDGANRAYSTKSEYGYGYVFSGAALRKILAAGTPPPPRHAQPDEDAVYEIAGQRRLRPLASHGAHVLGLAAATMLPRNRISPSRFGSGDATEPPSWQTESIDPDLGYAFVQIPRAALDDSSGRWLGRNILDGIHALIDYAVSTNTVERATINVSYGPQTGPHDGSSLLELAIDDLVANQKRLKDQKHLEELFVVLPSGNSYQSRANAEFCLNHGGGSLTWHVSPDSETPAFVEIWLPPGTSLASVKVAITSADGVSITAAANRIVEPPGKEKSWQVVSVNSADSGTPAQWVVLVALSATGGYESHARPSPGRWTLSVTPIGKVKGVAHAYLARNDHNFGGVRRGKPGHFWLENYDPNRFMRNREDDLPETVEATVRIRSAGSINGLATGAGSRVAAGYRIADTRPAIYSSGGPSRGSRKGPDFAYPTDESHVFPGMISWGNRSGALVRLAGTSAAAPQYARDIDSYGRVALPPDDSPDDIDPRVGWGCRVGGDCK